MASEPFQVPQEGLDGAQYVEWASADFKWDWPCPFLVDPVRRRKGRSSCEFF